MLVCKKHGACTIKYFVCVLKMSAVAEGMNTF